VAFRGKIPDKVGRYEIVLRIAHGGMATVYLARAEGHAGSDRYVALKLTAEHLRDDPVFAEHLVEEAKLIANLRHPNVVPVLDVGDDHGAVFLVMEYVPGDSLGGLVDRAKKSNLVVPPRIGMRILVDALAGLHSAHEHGDDNGNPHRLVHRDFSPQNILVGTDGVARLTDFGIAKAVSRASLTVAGTMKGKIGYASPEQVRGKELDRRCDLWAAGVVAWEILAGRSLYEPHERSLLEIVKGSPPRIRTVVPDIPSAIDEALAYALQMDPANRPGTADALARMLSSAARKANMLAELEEVAAYVQLAVGPVLEERKQKIMQRRRKANRPLVRTVPSDATLVMVNAPLPPPPELPQRSDPPMVTPPIGDAPIPGPDRPSVTGRPMTPNAPMLPVAVPWTAPRQQEMLHENPVSPHPAPAGLQELTSVSSSGLSTFSRSRSSVTSVKHAKPGLAERAARLVAERPSLLVGVAATIAGLVLAGAILLFAIGTGFVGAKAKTAEDAEPIASAPVTFASASAGVPTTTSKTARAQLTLSANLPIARVHVGERMIDIQTPATSVVVDLTPDELATRPSIMATSSDGRTARASWSDEGALRLIFGEAPPSSRPSSKPRPKSR
jgi:serine/threonine-protein kinase